MALIDSYDSGGLFNAVLGGGSGQNVIGQTFTAPTNGIYKPTSVTFFLHHNYDYPTGPMVAKIYQVTAVDLAGTVVEKTASASIDANVVGTATGQQVTFTFPGTFEMTPGQAYAVGLEYSGAKYLIIELDDLDKTHYGRTFVYNAGFYTASSSDTYFYLYADPVPSILPTGVAPTSAVGTPSLSFGGITISPTGIAPTTTVGTPDIQTQITATGIAPTSALGEPTVTQQDPDAPPPTDWDAIGKEDKKVYVYKVYNSSGSYMGIWPDPLDDPEWTQALNTPGTTTTVRLPRTGNKRTEVRSDLTTTSGDTLITQAGEQLVVVSTTSNTVGVDTDVELNYNVDIYVHYGEYRNLATQDDNTITTQTGAQIVLAYGSPLGVRVFSGFVLDYELAYGDEAGVTVTLSSHGYELSQEVIRLGTTTTVSYASQAIETTLKAILDTNPGQMAYTSGSIAATGTSVPAKFQLNTKLEGIEFLADQTPEGFYWYGNVGENLVYLQQVSATADHTFILGRHIKSMKLKRSLENLVNEVYFVGGEVTPGDETTTLYKKYSDATSQSTWRKGLLRKTDRRYTLATSTQKYADKQMARYGDPVFTTPLVISAARYDTESIRIGQTVGFANFGTFVDDLVLQIVRMSYTPYAVELELGELLARQADILSDIEKSLDNEQYVTVPATPA